MPPNPKSREYIHKKISSKRLSSETIYNPNNSFFNKLTKFFSGPITKHKTPDISNPKRRDMLKYKFSDVYGVPFKRQDVYANFNIAQSEQNLNTLRIQRYSMYEQMEMSPPEVSKALDIYAGEITTYTDYSPILKIESPKDEIIEILHEFWYNVIGIEENLFDWTRTLAKNGDLFLWMDINPDLGVLALRSLPVSEIERLEGEDPTNPNYVQFQWNTEGITFENFEIAHFRIKGNEKFWPYGTSVLFPALKIVQQLNLMIEQMMSYRIVRGPERLAFYYDVTGLEADKVEAFIEDNITKTKRQAVTNPYNGTQNLRYDVIGVEQNYHIPVKKGSETKIQPIPGGQFPVRKNSLIPLLDGRVVTIEELAMEYDQEKDIWVYSVEDKSNSVVPGKVSWCGKNYHCENMCRVWLDNDLYIDVAPEHPFVLRDGTKKRADLLKENDSLMPFRTKLSKKENKIIGYQMVCDPRDDKWKFTHKIVAEATQDKNIAIERSGEKHTCVHHIDFNKRNNNPENLKFMGFWEHRDYHNENVNNSNYGLHSENSKSKCRLYLKSENHKNFIKKMASDPSSNIYKWINSDENKNRLKNLVLTKEGEILRRKVNSERWNYPGFRENHSGKNHWKYKKWENIYKKYSIDDLIDFCNKNNIFYMKDYLMAKDNFLGSKAQIRKFLQYNNINSWTEFSNKFLLKKIKNHKVKKIEFINESDDVYCMTVIGPNGENDRHNFAILGQSLEREISKFELDGVFVSNTSDIEDVELIRDQMFTALGIPGSYMSNKNNDGEQTSLAQKSMLFARTILRIQHAIIAEIKKISMVHLMCLGYEGNDLLDIKFKLNNPSKLAEMQEYEHLKLKFEIAGAAADQGWSRRKIQTELWGWTPDEIHRNTYEILGDAKFQMMLSNIENQVGSQGFGGGGGDFSGLGPSAGGGGGIEGLDQMMQGEPPEDSEADFANIDTNAEENGLLVQPDSGNTQQTEKARRSDVYLTPGAKGKKYSPSKMDGRQTGQRLNNFNAQAGRNSIRGIGKNIFPGKSSLSSIARGIFPENKDISKDDILITEAENSQNEINQLIQESKEKTVKIKKALENYKLKELLKEQNKRS